MKPPHILAIIGMTMTFCAFMLVLGFHVHEDNREKTLKIRLAKIEACKAITDEALRALCVVEGGRGEVK